jgi:hypothetical protein
METRKVVWDKNDEIPTMPAVHKRTECLTEQYITKRNFTLFYEIR